MRLFVFFRLLCVVLRPTFVFFLLRPFAVLSLYEDLRQVDECSGLCFTGSFETAMGVDSCRDSMNVVDLNRTAYFGRRPKNASSSKARIAPRSIGRGL